MFSCERAVSDKYTCQGSKRKPAMHPRSRWAEARASSNPELLFGGGHNEFKFWRELLRDRDRDLRIEAHQSLMKMPAGTLRRRGPDTSESVDS